jgi:arsenical pump membrane protein
MDIATFVFIGAALLFMSAPSIGSFQVRPWHVAFFATALLYVTGYLDGDKAVAVAKKLSPALMAITALMVTSAVVSHAQLLERLLTLVMRRGRSQAKNVFNRLFMLSAVASALLSNDLAILILTPATISYSLAHFPNNHKVLVALCFAVFTAAGVAPLPTSNPMNLIFVAQFDIELVDYVRLMGPISVGIWGVSWGVLRLIFRTDLAARESVTVTPRSLSALQKKLLLLIGLQGVAYIVGASLGVAIWVICWGVALASLLVSRHSFSVRHLAKRIDVETLLFLAFIYLFTAGLRGSQITVVLADFYSTGSLAMTALLSGLGSALINNHPMAALSLNALNQVNASVYNVVAALIGGDVGPRLLFTGSLAGLLWHGCLVRNNVVVSHWQFARVGLMTTLPSVFAGVLLLQWMSRAGH